MQGGFSYNEIVYELPLTLVNQLAAALDQNRRIDLMNTILGMNAALLHALDCGFGKGKGKILDKWLKATARDLFKEKALNESPEAVKTNNYNALSSIFPTMTAGKRPKRGK